MALYSYPAHFQECEDVPGEYLITFPDVPEAITQARREDAPEMAKDALELILFQLYVAQKRDLPKPGKFRGPDYSKIDLPALTTAKLALYQAMKDRKVRKADLARRMGIPKQQVERLFDFRRQSRLDQIEKAFQVIGSRLVLTVEDDDDSATKKGSNAAAKVRLSKSLKAAS
jgi:antitoxin HicB